MRSPDAPLQLGGEKSGGDDRLHQLQAALNHLLGIDIEPPVNQASGDKGVQLANSTDKG